MQYDRTITISVGASRRATHWQPQTMRVSELYEKLRLPARGAETLTEYLSLPKGKQDDLKDVGGFVAGTLSGPRRKAGAVTGRDVLTLDLDNIPAGGTNDVLCRVEGLGCGYCVYSTRKHMPSAPRLRVLLPLDRTVTADEYEPCARRMAEYIGITLADPTTFEPSRLMYWPSCCADSDYIYLWQDKPMLSADGLLSTFTDWRDTTSWPQVPGAQGPARLAAKQGDPLAKKGVVGAFCRVYSIEDAMDAFLPGVYLPVDAMPGRYTFTGGSTTGGAVLYDNGKFLYSHHATDPCGSRLVNAFDLVRLHRFADLDDEAKPGTLAHQLPSYKAMEELCRADEKVTGLLNRERGEVIMAAFQTSDEPDKSPELAGYLGGLKGEILTTSMVRRLLSLLGIGIKMNEITWHVEVVGYPKEWSRANAENLLPVKLLDHLRLAGVKGAAKGTMCDCLDVIAEENRYNPVKEMLEAADWDGTDRLEELYGIWGVADPFYRSLMRKWLIQCVAMACNDELTPLGAEGVLVTQGEQGIGKTSALRELVPLPRMFKEGARLDMREKDTYIQALNCWICELGELDRTTARDSAGLKAFVTQDLDEYRTPYARKSVQRPRRTSFCGTVNPGEYLVDETGNRRFWTVPLKRIDLDRLFSLTNEWKHQFWGQVYAMYLEAPQGFRLNYLERSRLGSLNTQHTKALDFELELREQFDPDLPLKDWGEFTATEVSSRLLARPPANRLGRVLTKLTIENKYITSRILDGRRIYRLPMRKAQDAAALRLL